MNSKQRRSVRRLLNIHTGKLMSLSTPFLEKDVNFLNKIATKIEKLGRKVKKSDKKIRN